MIMHQWSNVKSKATVDQLLTDFLYLHISLNCWPRHNQRTWWRRPWAPTMRPAPRSQKVNTNWCSNEELYITLDHTGMFFSPPNKKTALKASRIIHHQHSELIAKLLSSWFRVDHHGEYCRSQVLSSRSPAGFCLIQQWHWWLPVPKESCKSWVHAGTFSAGRSLELEWYELNGLDWSLGQCNITTAQHGEKQSSQISFGEAKVSFQIRITKLHLQTWEVLQR